MTGYGDIAMAGIGIVLKAERFPLQFGIGLCQGVVPLAADVIAAVISWIMFAVTIRKMHREQL